LVLDTVPVATDAVLRRARPALFTVTQAAVREVEPER